MKFWTYFRAGLTAITLFFAFAAATFAGTAAIEMSQDAQQERGRQSLDVWTAAAVAYTWVDISTTGQPTGISGNDSTSGPIPLDISFRWFGTTQTAIRICTNGFLSFNSTANTGVNTAIPNVAEPNGAFAGHRWCDPDPWFYGPSILVADPSSWAPFHPTPAGQQAIADAVLGVLRGGDPGTVGVV